MRDDRKPFISVIMGVFYRKTDLSMLCRSIQSILDQTYQYFELIICDDGSTDEAKAKVNAFAQEDKRIKVIRPGSKYDLASKLNACLSVAQGEYIARMDDDDYSFPERFQKQVEFLNNNISTAYVGCNVNLVCNGVKAGERILPYQPKIRDFYFVQPYIHPTLMFRKEALQNIDGYSEKKHQVLCEDYDLLLRLFYKGYFGINLQEVLLDYTVPERMGDKRKMHHRWNETITRWNRFHELGVLHSALPYVFKPLVVGIVKKIKNG